MRYTRKHITRGWYIEQWTLVFLSCGLYYPWYRWKLHKAKRPMTESYYE